MIGRFSLDVKLEAPAIPYLVGAAAVASTGAAIYGATRGAPKPPAPPKPPTQDTAANAALQQQQQMLRRRGVLANIFAGGQAGTPQVAKVNLGD